jgi:hypothetical protein
LSPSSQKHFSLHNWCPRHDEPTAKPSTIKPSCTIIYTFKKKPGVFCTGIYFFALP